MKRLLLYVHFNKYGQVSDHVRYQLSQLRPLFNHILLISNSPVSDVDRDHLFQAGLMDTFLQRENQGFDFVAWKEGMVELEWETILAFDSVTLMNDTCFGPLWDLTPVFEKMESDSAVDFWGMTNYRATKDFKEHLQSYFLSFKSELVHSPVFREFWDTVAVHDDVQKVINLFETRLTDRFVEAGFTYKALFDTRECSTNHMAFPDFSFYNPTEILNQRLPFLKVKALEGNQHIAAYLLEELERISDYPVDVIRNHMSMMFLPTAKYLMKDKYLPFDDTFEHLTLEGKTVAIHLHAFYVDLLPEFFEIFQTYPFDFDLFITTDKDEKVSAIEENLNCYQLSAIIKVTGNRGRDILPMIKLKDELAEYDYVGHFHTKKSKEADFWAGESWRTELIAMLVAKAPAILAELDDNKQVGLVIADIPTYFRYVQLDPHYEGTLVPYMNKLWQKMNLAKSMDFEALSTYVMSYGTYIWFRYDALKPLFDLNLTDKDVPGEPLPQATILHAIERILLYLAWAQGYDFKIAQNPIKLPPFVDVSALNTRESKSFNPYRKVDLTYYGGLRGVLKYFKFINKSLAVYVLKQIKKRLI